MGVYKDVERGTWFVELRYKNAYGEPKKKKKRGFKKQSETKKWEARFLNSLYSDPEITFENLYNEYIKDNEKRCKKTTLYNKKSYFKSHILPYFGKMKIKDISALAIRKWQNELLKNNYSQTYCTNNYLHFLISHSNFIILNKIHVLYLEVWVEKNQKMK
ncbi:N-terminal phage integrase SAM-like domain-containing protein [Leptotrichia alba]|uniref:N-terminal phage integrase SAM-like domain-containing protein n=1 Tax=Leptotrichia alba TaxID=3239304 RepID=A0AB39V170_9FUSO